MNKKHVIHLLLFLVTFVTTTIAGAEWSSGKFVVFNYWPLSWDDILLGLEYSIPLLGILTVHEFAHYFAARFHNVATTLPYYIPMWLGFAGIPLLIGTMGAVIRITGTIRSRTQFFDIGIAGPLAGFIVAVGVLFYGFHNLPPKDYVFNIHPEFAYLGDDFEHVVFESDTSIAVNDLQGMPDSLRQSLPDTLHYGAHSNRETFKMGTTLLFSLMETYVADPQRVPSDYEIFHYPWLFAGFLALFFTAINLLPIGQLDGGHVIYGLFGAKRHEIIAKVLFILFVGYAGIGVITFPLLMENPLWALVYAAFLFLLFRDIGNSLADGIMVTVVVFVIQFTIPYFFPSFTGYYGWLLFALIVGRVLGIKHPSTPDERPLTTTRKILGWIALLVFILSFSPRPFILT